MEMMFWLATIAGAGVFTAAGYYWASTKPASQETDEQSDSEALTRARTALQKAQAEVIEIRKQADATAARNTELQTELADAKDAALELEHAQHRISMFKNEAATQAKKIEQLEIQASALQAAADKAEGQPANRALQQAQQAAENARVHMAEAAQELAAQVERCEALERELARSKLTVQNLQARTDTAEKQARKRGTTEQRAMQAEKDALQASELLAAAIKRATDAEQKLARAETAASAANDKLAHAEKKLSNVNRRLADAEARLLATEEQDWDLDNAMAAFGDPDDKTREVPIGFDQVRLQDDLSSLREQLASKDQELEQARALNEETRTSLETEVEAKAEALRMSDASKRELKRKVAKLFDQIADLREQLDKAKSRAPAADDDEDVATKVETPTPPLPATIEAVKERVQRVLLTQAGSLEQELLQLRQQIVERDLELADLKKSTARLAELEKLLSLKERKTLEPTDGKVDPEDIVSSALSAIANLQTVKAAAITDAEGLLVSGQADQDDIRALAALVVPIVDLARSTRDLIPLGQIRRVILADDRDAALVALLSGDTQEGDGVALTSLLENLKLSEAVSPIDAALESLDRYSASHTQQMG
jgi:chromosome segregation ATPase